MVIFHSYVKLPDGNGKIMDSDSWLLILVKAQQSNPTMWGPRSIAKLVHTTPISLYMVYDTYNYSYWGETKPTDITGGPQR